MIDKDLVTMFRQLGIVNFRIVLHSIQKHIFLRSAQDTEHNVANIEKIILLFESNDEVWYISTPPSSVNIIQKLVEACINGGCSYCKGHLDLDSVSVNNSTSDKFEPNSYLKLMEHEKKAIESYDIEILRETHMCIQHSISVVTALNECTNLFNKNEICLEIKTGGRYHGLYSNRPLTTGTYLQLVQSIEKDEKAINKPSCKLTGRVFIPAKIAQIICSYIVTNLMGPLILSNQSFIKASDLGKRIFNSDLNVIDDPFYFRAGSCVDSEGSPLHQKVLISHGILNDCLCDILSSSKLNCSSGNATYNYYTNQPSVSASVIRLHFGGKVMCSKQCDIIVQGINPMNFSYDKSTNVISGEFIGREYSSSKLNLYSFCETLTAFFDKIIGTTDEYSLVNELFLPDLILFWGAK